MKHRDERRVKRLRGRCLQRLSKYYWWEPPEESLQFDYFRNSSLHGLKYMGQPDRHLVERIFWLVAFTCGVVVAFMLIQNVFLKYIQSPVIVSFQPFETQIDEIPFPAITICNMNKVLRSKANEYIRNAADPSLRGKEKKNAIKNIYYLDHVCSSTKSFSKKFNYSLTNGAVTLPSEDVLKEFGDDIFGDRSDVKDFLDRASQPCQDMLELCIWHEDPVSCREIFKPIETDFGKCCTFNMIPPTLLDTLKNDTRDDPIEVHEWAKWNVAGDGLFIKKNYTFPFPRRQMRAGRSFGLSFLLDPNMDEYFCTTSDSQGFRLAAHLPIEFPQIVDFGIALKPRSEIFIGLRPEIVMSEQVIEGFPLEKRECYFPGEYQLQYYNYYTAANCINECIANETYKQCTCVTYYMPRDNTRELCGPKKFSCVRTVKRVFSDGGQKTSCTGCLPSCTEIRYQMEVTETPLQSDNDLWIDQNLKPAPWVGQNVSVVHVYFCLDSTYARLRKELYGITDLIANTGGLMGLCLGFSGLSLVEIIYFLTLRAWFRTRNNSQKPAFARAAEKIQKLVHIWGPTNNKQQGSVGNESSSSGARRDPGQDEQRLNNLSSNFYTWELSPKVSSHSLLPVIGGRNNNEHQFMSHWMEPIATHPQFGGTATANNNSNSRNRNGPRGELQRDSSERREALSQYTSRPFWNVE